MDEQPPIVLTHLPESEEQLQLWAQQVSKVIAATIREREDAADQHCWRLSIDNQHWLLVYSAICQAAWLQPLEENSEDVMQRLREANYVAPN